MILLNICSHSCLCNIPEVQIETVRETVNVNVVQKEGVLEVETEIVTVKGAGGHEGKLFII